jgi:tRNA-(ms[2]io[6]A)-hydroxylase
MLCLKGASSPEWVTCALENLDAVLVDHAHCEHKAAVTALALVSRYPDDPELVARLSALAAEEADHLHRVAAHCAARGVTLGHPQQDGYAKQLLALVRRDPLGHRVDRLLVCALIEARSCERLKMLAENLENPDLQAFYDELWRCEAGHYALFVELARRSLERVGGRPAERAKDEVKARIREIAEKEAEIVAALPIRPAIH